MAALTNEKESTGDFKNKQFKENEVSDKVVEQCTFLSLSNAFVCCRNDTFFARLSFVCSVT